MDIDALLVFRPTLGGGSFNFTPSSLASIVRGHFERSHGPVEGAARASAYFDAIRARFGDAAGAPADEARAPAGASTAAPEATGEPTPPIPGEEAPVEAPRDEEPVPTPVGDGGRPAMPDRTAARSAVHAIVRSASVHAVDGAVGLRAIDGMRRAWASDPAIARIHPVLTLPDSEGGIAEHVESPTSLRSILRGLVADGLLWHRDGKYGVPEDGGRRPADGPAPEPKPTAEPETARTAPEHGPTAPRAAPGIVSALAGILGLAATGAMIAGAMLADRSEED